MARADEQGFGTDKTWYHGTSGDFADIQPTGSNTKARSAKSAVWLADDPEVAAGYARMAAEDAPINRLIDKSKEAERAGNFDLSERLQLDAEALEYGGELIDGGGQNIIPALTRRVGIDSYDVGGRSMSDLDDSQLHKWLSDNKREGGGGIEVADFVDNADYSNYLAATHLGLSDPANIRSKFAAFDPDNKGLNNLLGSMAGAGVIGASALGSEDADAGVINDPALLSSPAGGSGFLATADKWAAPVNDAAEFVFDALEVPVRGWHGIAGVLGELARGGDIESALANGGKYASQSIDDTSSDYGRAVADETGSPLAAALTHALTQMTNPI